MTFTKDCSKFQIDELEEWPDFTTYLEEIQRLMKNFKTFEIKHIPHTQKNGTDNFAHNDRNQLSYFVHIYTESLV